MLFETAIDSAAVSCFNTPVAPDGKKIALITGITGQDGSYLAEFLISKDYAVHGLARRSANNNTERIRHLLELGTLSLHHGDVTDAGRVEAVVAETQPDEIYHLAAQSHVGASFHQPEYTLQATGLSTVRFLEALRKNKPNAKFYQASSSELFGNAPAPQNEATPFHPESPYGIAKLLAYHATRLYRDAYGVFAVNGILFNHESPRRGEEFVTRKITLGAARITAGLQKEVVLGNLAAKRDWGYAPEYVEVMWRMLQNDRPEDFVIATGAAHSVQEFAEAAFRHAGLDWRNYVRVDPALLRPSEVNQLVGDAAKARRLLGWEPKMKFEDLVHIMVEADLKRVGTA